MQDVKFLNRKGAARFFYDRGVPTSAATLEKLASVGGGPAMRKFGRRVLYEPEALEAWIDEKLTAPRRSTSDVGDVSPRRDR